MNNTRQHKRRHVWAIPLTRHFTQRFTNSKSELQLYFSRHNRRSCSRNWNCDLNRGGYRTYLIWNGSSGWSSCIFKWSIKDDNWYFIHQRSALNIIAIVQWFGQKRAFGVIILRQIGFVLIGYGFGVKTGLEKKCIVVGDNGSWARKKGKPILLQHPRFCALATLVCIGLRWGAAIGNVGVLADIGITTVCIVDGLNNDKKTTS